VWWTRVKIKCRCKTKRGGCTRLQWGSNQWRKKSRTTGTWAHGTKEGNPISKEKERTSDQTRKGGDQGTRQGGKTKKKGPGKKKKTNLRGSRKKKPGQNIWDVLKAFRTTKKEPKMFQMTPTKRRGMASNVQAKNRKCKTDEKGSWVEKIGTAWLPQRPQGKKENWGPKRVWGEVGQ